MFINTLPNAIINGGFNFWQRGQTFPAIATNTYSADRWKYFKTGTMVHTISRSTDVPTSAMTNYSLLATITTAQASLGASDGVELDHFIEGNFAARLYGKKVALAFWVKASKAGIYCISLANSATDRVYTQEYTINAINTWERKILRIYQDPAGSWLKDSNKGIEVCFTIAAGSGRATGVNNVWGSTGTVLGTSNQVNLCDTNGATFQLSEVVMIEDNTDQTRVPNFVYAGRDYCEELVLCQRYYEKSYDLDTVPGVIANNGSITSVGGSSGTGIGCSVQFKAMKRIVPTAIAYDPTTGTINQTHGSGGAMACTSPDANGMTGLTYSSGGVGTNRGINYHFTADADF